MRIRTAVLVSLLVAAAAGYLGYRFVPPIPLAQSPAPEFVNALLLGRLCAAVLVASAVYATVVCAIIGGGIIAEFVALRRPLHPVEASSNPTLKRGAWE